VKPVTLRLFDYATGANDDGLLRIWAKILVYDTDGWFPRFDAKPYLPGVCQTWPGI